VVRVWPLGLGIHGQAGAWVAPHGVALLSPAAVEVQQQAENSHWDGHHCNQDQDVQGSPKSRFYRTFARNLRANHLAYRDNLRRVRLTRLLGTLERGWRRREGQAVRVPQSLARDIAVPSAYMQPPADVGALPAGLGPPPCASRKVDSRANRDSG
jgi:hypothetical protein